MSERGPETEAVDSPGDNGEPDNSERDNGEPDNGEDAGTTVDADDTADTVADTVDADDTVDDGAAVDGVPATLEQEGDLAADYLQELLDIADLDGDLDVDVEGQRAIVSIIPSEEQRTDLQQLVGTHGAVVDALQELARLAVLAATGERSRLLIDVDGYRASQRSRLVRQAEEAVAKVRQGGEPVRLPTMTAYERKIVHDAVAAAGLVSESEGEEPQRRVVVLPAG